MEKIVTRFRPTSGNGPLHAGHLINAYAAFLFAKRHGGEFLVICDPMYLVPGEFADFPPDDRLTGPTGNCWAGCSPGRS